MLRKNFSNWAVTYSGVLIMKEVFDQPFEDQHKFLAGLLLDEISQVAPNRFGKWLMVSALERVALPEKAALLSSLIPLMQYCCSLPQGTSYAGIVTGEISAFYRDANQEQKDSLTDVILAEMGEGRAKWLLDHPEAVPSEAVLESIVTSPRLWELPSALDSMFARVFVKLPVNLRETLLSNMMDSCKEWACTDKGSNTLIRFCERASEEEMERLMGVLQGHEKEILLDEHGSKLVLFLIRRAPKHVSAPFVKLLLDDYEFWIGEADRLEQVKFAIRLADADQISQVLERLSQDLYNACVSPVLQPVLQEVQKLCSGEVSCVCLIVL